MQSTVRFAEPERLQPRPPTHHHQHGDVAFSGGFRLPKISSANVEFLAGGSSSEQAAAAAAYNRHDYSLMSSPEATAAYWKYPLPSKSFRLYVGPSLREPPPAGTAYQAASQRSWSRSQADADARPGQLQRSRTEPAMSTSSGAGGGQPFLPSRAQIFLRRRLPSTPQQQLQLCREATMATTVRSSEDEEERLRWTMSTQRHWQPDRKGQQRNQGPFSREFTVHVTAPSNWMRMKWGRRQAPQLLELRQADTQQQTPQSVSYMYTKQAFGQQLQL